MLIVSVQSKWGHLSDANLIPELKRASMLLIVATAALG